MTESWRDYHPRALWISSPVLKSENEMERILDHFHKSDFDRLTLPLRDFVLKLADAIGLG